MKDETQNTHASHQSEQKFLLPNFGLLTNRFILISAVFVIFEQIIS